MIGARIPQGTNESETRYSKQSILAYFLRNNNDVYRCFRVEPL